MLIERAGLTRPDPTPTLYPPLPQDPMDRIDRQFSAATGRNALVVIAVVVAGAAFYWLNTIRRRWRWRCF